jgi:hypothetical protein
VTDKFNRPIDGNEVPRFAGIASMFLQKLLNPAIMAGSDSSSFLIQVIKVRFWQTPEIQLELVLISPLGCDFNRST